MKAYFKQKSATELYQEVSESPHDFLLRALNLNSRLFLYQTPDGSIKYEPSLVHASFLHGCFRDKVTR